MVHPESPLSNAFYRNRNLTVANHVIFLSPMFAKSKEHYKATETQAVGRVRRYGQTRQVNVWRFVARDTIDVEIYERFTGRNFQRELDEHKPLVLDSVITDEPTVATMSDDSVDVDPSAEDDGKLEFVDVHESSTESGISSHPSPVSTTADMIDDVAGLAMSSDEKEMTDVLDLVDGEDPAEDDGMDLDKDKDLELTG